MSSCDNAAASAIIIACPLDRLDNSIVLAARESSKAICCSAVKFILAMSPIRAELATRAWNAWSNSMPINVARCCAARICLCCLLDKFCASNCAIVAASI